MLRLLRLTLSLQSAAPSGIYLGLRRGGISMAVSGLSTLMVEPVRTDSRRARAFFSAWVEMRLSSLTKDWPQKALLKLLVSYETCDTILMKDEDVTYLVYFCTYLSNFSKFIARCSALMVTASWIVVASSSVFQGLKIRLPFRL